MVSSDWFENDNIPEYIYNLVRIRQSSPGQFDILFSGNLDIFHNLNDYVRIN